MAEETKYAPLISISVPQGTEEHYGQRWEFVADNIGRAIGETRTVAGKIQGNKSAVLRRLLDEGQIMSVGVLDSEVQNRLRDGSADKSVFVVFL